MTTLLQRHIARFPGCSAASGLRKCSNPQKGPPTLGPCRQAAAATANVQDAERREECEDSERGCAISKKFNKEQQHATDFLSLVVRLASVFRNSAGS